MPTSTRQSGFGQLYFMKLIPLSVYGKKNAGKYFAQVDDEDYDFLMHWSWYAIKNCKRYYAIRHSPYSESKIYMHRIILGLDNKKLYADHIDGDGLNNQRNNLRVATPQQNCANRIKAKNKTSKYRGVCLAADRPERTKWNSHICINGKSISLGNYAVEEDAARAYDKKAISAWGVFARLNFPNENNQESVPL
jgi:hypothetical protein